MINDRTIEILDELGFGVDIDSIESYIIDYRQAREVADLYDYEYNYNKLLSVLKDIKIASKAFNKSIELEELKKDKSDRLMEEYPSVRNKVSKAEIIDIIDSEENSEAEILALLNIEGIKIRVLYFKGELFRVNIVNKEAIYTDITDRLRNKIPKHIDKLNSYEVVELRGIITTQQSSKAKALKTATSNIGTQIMHLIRCELSLGEVEIVYNDVVIDSKGTKLPYSNQLEKLEYIDELGLNVVEYSLVSEIKSDNLDDAIEAFDEYFNSIGSDYRNKGYEFRINESYRGLIYVSDEVEGMRVEVNSIVLNPDTLRVELGVYEIPDKIEIRDMYLIDKLGIDIGSIVTIVNTDNKFRLIEEY